MRAFFIHLPLVWLPHPFGGYSAAEPGSWVSLVVRHNQLVTGSLALAIAIAFALWSEIRLRGLRASLGFTRYAHQWLLWAFLGILILIGGTILAVFPLPSFNIGGRMPFVDLRQIGTSHLVLFVLGAFLAALSEAALRGVAQPALTRQMTVWPAIGVTAALSLSIGTSLLSPPIPHIVLTLCFAVAVQIFLGWIRYRSGSLWPSLTVHALFGGLMVAALRN